MRFRKFLAIIFLSFSLTAFSQTPSEVAKNPKPEEPKNDSQEDATRQRKVQAYAKLLEGQRYFWQIGRSRFRSNAIALARQAKQAFLKAVELDPTLAEGYTALAELALYEQPPNYDEAILYAQNAVKVNPNNFGARRILAGVYSIRSGLNSARYNEEFAQKAKAEWLEVTRLDPRNAEAWAFLSAFYEREGNQEKRIEALRQWLASVSPIEARFYRIVFGNLADLSPEVASLKLADALVKTNRSEEAIEILSRLVVDQPENREAVELLREVLGFASEKLVSRAISALEQAVLSEPNNFSLVDVLVEAQIHARKAESAIKTLQSVIKKIINSETAQLVPYYFKLSDAYFEADDLENSIGALEQILKIYGIADKLVDSSEKADVAERVFGRMIYFYKHFGRYANASSVIERSRKVLGAGNSFPDKEMIDLLAESGRRREALQYIYSVRKKTQLADAYKEKEAEILAALGQVEEAAALIKSSKKINTSTGSSLKEDEKKIADIDTLIRVCQLYLLSDRPQEAMREASRVLELSQNDQQRMIARILLSAAYYDAGDFATSEKILREMIQRSPNNPILLNNLGYFLAERNEKLNEALEMIKKAVRIEPNNPSYLDSLGYVYLRLGNKEEAERYFRRAIRQETNSSEIYEHLGDVYQALGKIENARMAWQRALHLATNEKAASRVREKLRRISK
ncbi:MAG: tetratricopeptide repeat protein [Acidobacteria bacterium]|jgi:tetratricopeptide (TPR) repeat protein|nr:MAG: tetratricopeptide repeat protein [Acidobacteriota bacterium]GIU81648.1 MAG: hypothetical protein KatS3mg006_0712 [Pyrinomonadaceae bacterium]